MTTAMRTNGPLPRRPKTDCQLADRVAGMETPMPKRIRPEPPSLLRSRTSSSTPGSPGG